MPDRQQDIAPSPADEARRLIASIGHGVLAVDLPARAGWPYAALVKVASDEAGRPTMLLSDLAEHTKALRAADGGQARVSLLLDGTTETPDRLAGARLTVLGHASLADEGSAGRFLDRHPEARAYAGFGDFNIWRIEPASAHLVAGFGRIVWIEGGDLA